MPYEAVRPVTLEVANEEGVLPTILHPCMPADIGTLKRSWMQLQEERDSYRERFNEQEQKNPEADQAIGKRADLE